MKAAGENSQNPMSMQTQGGKKVPGAITRAGSRTYWICQVVGWGGYGLGYYATVLLPLHQAGWAQCTSDALYCAAGLTTTHLLRGWMRSRRWLQRDSIQLLWRLIAACCLLGGVQAVVLESALLLFRVVDRSQIYHLPATLLIISFFSAILIGLWIAVYIVVNALRIRRRAELDKLRAELRLQEAQLRALRQQINPHFLFNSLNSIRSMIQEDAASAREMLTRLADLLRFSLQAGEQGMVTMAEELRVVKDYLALEAIRLEERLQVEWQVDATVLSVVFPAMMLQGLVENAIKHGVSRRMKGGWIRIEVSRQKGLLRICVENSGILGEQGQGGIGLSNTQERLQLLYAGKAGVEMTATDVPSVRVQLWLPLESAFGSASEVRIRGVL